MSVDLLAANNVHHLIQPWPSHTCLFAMFPMKLMWGFPKVKGLM